MRITRLLVTSLVIALGLLLASAGAYAKLTDQSAGSKQAQKGTGTTASQPATQQPGATAMEDKMDKSFINKATHESRLAVALSRLAQERSSDANVKSYAQQMIDEHTRLNASLKQIADKKGLAVPTSHPDQTKIMGKLQSLHGAAFDKSYLSDMRKIHDREIALFQRETNKGQDAEFKQFAQSNVATLQTHLRTTEQTSSQLSQRGQQPAPAARTGQGTMKQQGTTVQPQTKPQGAMQPQGAGAGAR